MAEQQKSLEEMSLDELRELTLAELDKPAEQAQEQQRNPDGTFAKKEELAPAADEEVVYQRTIDLGDGAGVQVFEGKTLEELVDKLAKAQKHATRKIREQAAKIKTQPEPLPSPVEKELTAEEKWLLQQRMLQDPVAVIKEFAAQEAKKLEDARAAAEAAAKATIEAAEKATNDWVAANPNYYASPKNGTKIQKFLEVQGLDLTPENLTLAFNDLSESGLLEARPAEATNAEPEEKPAAQPTRRIVEATVPAVTTVRRKVVGEISTKRSAPVAATTPELTEEQLNKMSLAELERLAYKSLAG